MAIDVTTIGLGADTSKLKTATKELDNFGKSADKAADKADEFSDSANTINKTSSAVTVALGRMASALAAVATVGALTRTIDEYTKFTAQLKLATRSQEEYNKAFSDVNRIATTAQASISSIGVLYARLNNALRDVGVSQSQVGKITETVGLALKVSGATASESASAMLQLSQAFGSGVLRGEEFNAVNEAAPALMRALAESIGVPIGALRELASDGQITSEVLAKAFGDDALLNKFREQAKEIGTIGGALQVVKNELSSLIAMVDKGTGFSSWVKDTFGSLAEYLKAIQLVLNDGTLFEKLRFFTIGNLSERLTTRLRSPAGVIAGSQVPGSRAINADGNISPNFTSPRAVGDIRKIHQEQEEALKKSKESAKKAQDAAKKAVEDEIKLIKYKHDFEQELNNEAYKNSQMALKIQAKDEKEAYETKLKQLNKLQDLANENYKNAQDEFKKAEQEKLKEFEKTVDGINQTFREGFANLVNGGKGSWKSFTQSLFTTFKTTVADQIYKLFAQPLVVKLVASVLGIGAAGSAQAGEGGISSIFSDLTDSVKSMNNNIVGSIEDLGSFLSNGNGGLADSIGGFLGENAGVISKALPFAGSALSLLSGDVKGAVGSALGAALSFTPLGPVGGIVGSVLGKALGGVFGSKKPRAKIISSSANTVFANGEVLGNDNTPYASGKRFVELGAQSTLNNLNAAFSNNLSAILKGFGLQDNIATYSVIGQRKDTARGSFNAYVNDTSPFAYDIGGTGTAESAFQAMMEAVLSKGVVAGIQASRLPQSIKDLFNSLTTKEQVSNMINATLSLNAAQKQLADTYNLTVTQAAQVAKVTGLVGDDLTTFVNKLVNVANSAKSVGQSLLESRTSLENSLFNLFGSATALPNTIDEFDAKLKSIDVSKNSGVRLFSGLFALRDQYQAFQNADDSLRANVRGALFDVVSDAERQQMLNEKLAKLFGDLGREVPASIQELINLGKSIDYTTKEGLDLAAVFPSLVTAFNETQNAVESLMNTMRDSSKFASSFEFNRYTGVAGNYGAAFANQYVDSIPSYDVGTSYVPKTGMAMLHQGEAVLTKNDNAGLSGAINAMANEIYGLRQDNKNMRAELQSIAINSSKSERSLDRLQKDGFIIRDVDANGDPQILQVEVV